MFQINRALSATQNLLGLVNNNSTYAFTGTEFTIGVPSAQTPADPEENTNSQVTLTAVVGSGFIGTKTSRYRRLAIGATRPGALVNYTIGAGDTQADLKEMIAVEHNLVSSDFTITGTMPTVDQQTEVFAVTAINDSLLYTGTINVNVKFVA